jgi:hypothetical protein
MGRTKGKWLTFLCLVFLALRETGSCVSERGSRLQWQYACFDPPGTSQSLGGGAGYSEWLAARGYAAIAMGVIGETGCSPNTTRMRLRTKPSNTNSGFRADLAASTAAARMACAGERAI